VKLQGAVGRPTHSPPGMAMHLSSPGVKSHVQIVAGLSLGAVLSAGSAQQSVNQEGLRDEAAKHNAAKGDAAKQSSRRQQILNEGTKSTRNGEGKSNIESAGESGNGFTASGAASRPLRRTPAQENW
jgi:hypothetical protein